MIITQNTLQAMHLCYRQKQLAEELVGEEIQVTPVNILRAIELGLDVSYFPDYWMREDAGNGLPGLQGAVVPHLRWLYELMWEEQYEIWNEQKQSGLRYSAFQQNARRAEPWYRTFSALWMHRRWPN